MSDKVYLGQNASDLDYDEKVSRISRVNLSVDSDHIYTSGDDTGRTLEVSCPWGSQAMADSILAKVSGIEYQPYEASDALLDPATEIGDGITLGGVYSVLAQSYVSLDKQCSANISAPYTDEIDDEYPYKTPEQRRAERQLAQTRSEITKTAEEINLKIEATDGRVSEVAQTVDGITLSAFRYLGEEGPEALLASVDANVTKPFRIAGSVNTFERIDYLKTLNNLAGFTIGGAFFEKKFGDSFAENITAVANRLAE